jgi:hypothetical protein
MLKFYFLILNFIFYFFSNVKLKNFFHQIKQLFHKTLMSIITTISNIAILFLLKRIFDNFISFE